MKKIITILLLTISNFCFSQSKITLSLPSGTGKLNISDTATMLSKYPLLGGTRASGTWNIGITGTSSNITAYTINQNLGTTNNPTFGDLTISNIALSGTILGGTGLLLNNSAPISGNLIQLHGGGASTSVQISAPTVGISRNQSLQDANGTIALTTDIPTTLSAPSKLYGSSASSSNLTSITIGSGLTMTGSTLSSSFTNPFTDTMKMVHNSRIQFDDSTDLSQAGVYIGKPAQWSGAATTRGITIGGGDNWENAKVLLSSEQQGFYQTSVESLGTPFLFNNSLISAVSRSVPSYYNSKQALVLEDSARSKKMIFGLTSAGDLQYTNTTGTIVSTLSDGGTLTAKNIYSTSSTPSVSLSTGAGTGASHSIAGTNQDFYITVTTAGTPSASGVIFTVTFSNSFAFPTGSIPVFSATGTNASQLSGTSQVSVSGSTTTVSFNAGSSALTTGQTYGWYVHVGGY